MKKLTTLCLILLALTSFAFAEDAKVMPMMVGRVYVAPTFSFAPGGYDTDGDYHSYTGSVKLFNLGLAIEYGVIDWITAAVQWAPGWTFWSDIEAASGYPKTNTNGVADLFVGAKIQIIGEKAPVQNTMFRAAAAPGVIVPLPGPDFSEEIKNVPLRKDAAFSKMDNHVFGAGARLYFDWIVNESLFINFYNETIFFPIAQDLKKDGPVFPSANAKLGGGLEGEVNYKYKLTFEIEPVFTKSIADGVSFSAGLPVNYKYIPAYDYSFDFPIGTPASAIPAMEAGILAKLNTDSSYILSVKPNVSVFLTNTPLPLEFKLQYTLPVWGNNSMARHDITLQVKAYFALPGRPE